MKFMAFLMAMTSLWVHVQAMISQQIVPMAAPSSLHVPSVPEPSDLSQIIAIEDDLPAEQRVLVLDAETTGFSHEKLDSRAPSSVDPRLYDFAAGLQASQASAKKTKKHRAQVEKELQEALSREEGGARLDTTTAETPSAKSSMQPYKRLDAKTKAGHEKARRGKRECEGQRSEKKKNARVLFTHVD